MSVVEIAADPVSEMLERAALLLEEFGWCQGRAGSREEGELCLVAAIATFPEGFTSGELVRRFAAAGIPNTPCGLELAAWNDVPGRTRSEVVAKLREAASL